MPELQGVGGGVGLGANSLTVGSGGRFPTIAAALAVAVSGQTVLVYPGTYTELQLIVPLGVSLVGIDARNTIIQADASLLGVTNRFLKLGGSQTVSGLTIYRNDGTEIATEVININVEGPGITIRNCRIGGGADNIYVASSVTSGIVDILDNDFYDVRWYCLTNAGTPAEINIKGNKCHSVCPALTLSGSPTTDINQFFYNNTAATNITIAHNDVYLQSATTQLQMAFLHLPAVFTAKPTVYSAHNLVRLEITGGATTPIKGFNITKATSKYVVDLTTEFDSITLTGGTVPEEISLVSSGSAPTYRGSVNIIGTNARRIANTFNNANLPLLTWAEKSQDVAFAVTDAATVTIKPFLSAVHTWTCTQATSLKASILFTPYIGQRFTIVVGDAGTHNITPDGTTVGGAVLATIAGKTVVATYIYNGTLFVQESIQSTGY